MNIIITYIKLKGKTHDKHDVIQNLYKVILLAKKLSPCNWKRYLVMRHEATSRPSLVFGSNENLQGQITCISLTLSKQTWSSVNKEKATKMVMGKWRWMQLSTVRNTTLQYTTQGYKISHVLTAR